METHKVENDKTVVYLSCAQANTLITRNHKIYECAFYDLWEITLNNKSFLMKDYDWDSLCLEKEMKHLLLLDGFCGAPTVEAVVLKKGLLILSHVPGLQLRDFLNNLQDPQLSCKVFCEIFRTLDKLHTEKGIIIGGLSQDNIVVDITSNKEVFIHLLSYIHSEDVGSWSCLYMMRRWEYPWFPLERFQGHEVCPVCDMYSVALIMESWLKRMTDLVDAPYGITQLITLMKIHYPDITISDAICELEKVNSLEWMKKKEQQEKEELEEEEEAFCSTVTITDLERLVTDVHKIGEGSYGMVYKVQFEGRPAVMKVGKKRKFNWYFQEEAGILMNLEGAGGAPSLLAVCAELPVFVMNLVPGSTIDSFDWSDCPVREIINAFEKIVHQLHRIHEKGLVHLDIKANNILYDADLTEFSLIDFGLARFIGDWHQMRYNFRLNWCAPELFSGTYVSPACDVYAIGALMEYIFSRKTLIPGVFFEGMMELECDGVKVPQDIFNLMLQLKSCEPEDRPSTLEILEILRKGLMELDEEHAIDDAGQDKDD